MITYPECIIYIPIWIQFKYFEFTYKGDQMTNFIGMRKENDKWYLEYSENYIYKNNEIIGVYFNYYSSSGEFIL